MFKTRSILVAIWTSGFGASLAIIGLTEIIPNGGWPEGILFYVTLLFFFPANMMGMAILNQFWKPNYMTPDGMPVTFWILSVCINWMVILCAMYFVSLLLKARSARTSDNPEK